jgi:hypothetical protein
MDVVDKEEDANLDHTLALKSLAAHLLESERREQRFLHKGQGDGVTQSPQHPQGPPGL